MEKTNNPDNFLPKTKIIDGKEVVRDFYMLASGNSVEILSDPENGKILKKTIHTALGDFTANQEKINDLAKSLNRKPNDIEEMIDEMMLSLYKEEKSSGEKPTKDSGLGTLIFRHKDRN